METRNISFRPSEVGVQAIYLSPFFIPFIVSITVFRYSGFYLIVPLTLIVTVVVHFFLRFKLGYNLLGLKAVFTFSLLISPLCLISLNLTMSVSLMMLIAYTVALEFTYRDKRNVIETITKNGTHSIYFYIVPLPSVLTLLATLFTVYYPYRPYMEYMLLVFTVPVISFFIVLYLIAIPKIMGLSAIKFEHAILRSSPKCLRPFQIFIVGNTAIVTSALFSVLLLIGLHGFSSECLSVAADVCLCINGILYPVRAIIIAHILRRVADKYHSHFKSLKIVKIDEGKFIPIVELESRHEIIGIATAKNRRICYEYWRH